MTGSYALFMMLMLHSDDRPRGGNGNDLTRGDSPLTAPSSSGGEEEDEDSDNEDAQSSVSADQTLRIDTHITPLTRKPSARKGRVSAVAEEPGTPTRR